MCSHIDNENAWKSERSESASRVRKSEFNQGNPNMINSRRERRDVDQQTILYGRITLSFALCRYVSY